MKKFLLILLFCVLSTHSFTQEQFIFSNRAYIWAIPVYQDSNVEHHIMFHPFELYFDAINGVLRVHETDSVREDWVIKGLKKVIFSKSAISGTLCSYWVGKTGYQKNKVTVEIKEKDGKVVSVIVKIKDLFTNIYTRPSEATDPLLR